MLANVKGGSHRILFVLLALAFRAAAQDQNVIIDTLDGKLIVSGEPKLTLTDPKKPTTLDSGGMASDTIFLALVNPFTGETTSCPVTAGKMFQIGSASTTVQVVIGGTISVSGTGAFSYATPQSNYVAWQWSGDPPDSTFAVSISGCNLGTDYSGRYFLITTTDPSSITIKGNTTGDPWIPILGRSLRFLAPKDQTFDCSNSQVATLDGPAKLSGVQITHYPQEPLIESYLNLPYGVSDWKITAYPQQLEISPNFLASKLTFSVPSPSTLACRPDAKKGVYLDVLATDNTNVRPQEFVLEWSPGWFQSRHTITIPCVSCALVLGKPKSK